MAAVLNMTMIKVRIQKVNIVLDDLVRVTENVDHSSSGIDVLGANRDANILNVHDDSDNGPDDDDE